MAKDYSQLVTTILDNIGGPDNIISVAHCITRLRLKLKDPSIAMGNADAISAMPQVIQVMDANGQVHVVVGNIIEDVYDQFIALPGVPSGAGSVDADEEEGNKTLAAIAIDLVSGIFAPSLGVLSAAGIMKGLLALVSFFIPSFANEGAYTVLYTIADGFFYFLPIVLGLNAARKFKMNEFVGLAIGFALVYPTIVAAAGGDVLGTVNLGFLGEFSWTFTFFGIPVIMPASGYPSSVIPVILMVALAARVEKWARGWMPDTIKMFMTPLLVMTVSIVAGYLVIGPVSTVVTNLLGNFFVFLYNLPGVGGGLGGFIVGAFWMVLVIFGFHWALVPLAMANFATLGYDMTLASMYGHSFALGAVIFAMYLKNKDEKFRGIALPAAISAFFFGVTEPAIYGIALPQKKPLIVASICSGITGAFLGFTGTCIYMMGGLGLFALPTYISSDSIDGMVRAAIAAAAAGALGFIFTFMTYNPEAEDGGAAAPKPLGIESQNGGVYAPVAGRIEATESIPDPAFASEVMGKTVAIWPSEGTVYAPVSGTVVSAMPHAFGFAADDGTEVLIHVGVDTVNMNGDGFDVLVEKGAHVTAGQPLLTFDRDKVAKAGYKDIVMCIVTNSDDYPRLAKTADGTVPAGTKVMQTA